MTVDILLIGIIALAGAYIFVFFKNILAPFIIDYS